jgi:hypothetical protein
MSGCTTLFDRVASNIWTPDMTNNKLIIYMLACMATCNHFWQMYLCLLDGDMIILCPPTRNPSGLMVGTKANPRRGGVYSERVTNGEKQNVVDGYQSLQLLR